MTRLCALLGEHPELATERLRNWCVHHRGASPLGYVAMLRYDTSHGVWRDVPDTGAMARALLDAGALVDGDPADSETPLMTAASYGDPEVARVLVEAGADLDAAASVTAGAVPVALLCGTRPCSACPTSSRCSWPLARPISSRQRRPVTSPGR